MRKDAASVTAQQEAPLVEQAYQALRQSLIHCEFEPGQRLRVEELQRRFGFSSSPLREALNRLVQQGLVKVLEHRGFRVAPMSVEAISDLTRVRLLVETETLRDSILHGDDQWEANLVAASYALSQAEKRIGSGPLVLDDAWSERHRAYHMGIYAACTSPLLLDMVEGLFDQAERFRRYSARYRKTDRAKNTEHQKLFEAVLARDVEKAVTLLQQHIRGTERNVTNSLLSLEGTQTH